MFQGQISAYATDLLVGLLGCEKIVRAEYQRSDIPEPLRFDPHGGPESRIQGCGDPCGAEERARVDVGKRLGAVEAGNLGEVAADVEPEEDCDSCLPDGHILCDMG